MVFRNNKGNMNIFALIIISVTALSLGSLMLGNVSVYQLSKGYHILRERLLIKKMLFQITEEVVLSKYELSASKTNEPLESLFVQEIAGIQSNTGLIFDAFKIVENHIKESKYLDRDENSIFKNGYRSFNPRLSSYLNQGPYIELGNALFSYDIHGRTYDIKVHGYGVPLSNFDLILYDLNTRFDKAHSISGQAGLHLKKDDLYFLDEDGKEIIISSQKSDISYKRRKDVSLLSNAYEWLWTSEYLQELAKNSANNFVLEIPYNGELEDNGVVISNDNEITLKLEKIDFDVIALSNPLGGGVIKLQESGIMEKPLIIISHNNLPSGQKTLLEIEQSIKRPIIVFSLNTEIRFKNSPQIKGVFFCDLNSKASGRVFLDGHFSCYTGSDDYATFFL